MCAFDCGNALYRYGYDGVRAGGNAADRGDAAGSRCGRECIRGNEYSDRGSSSAGDFHNGGYNGTGIRGEGF